MLSPEQIQSILGLKNTPTYATIGGEFQAGTDVFAGEAAGVDAIAANGGGLQIFGAAAAEGTEVIGIDGALEILGGLGLAALSKNRTTAP